MSPNNSVSCGKLQLSILSQYIGFSTAASVMEEPTIGGAFLRVILVSLKTMKYLRIPFYYSLGHNEQ